MKRENLARKEPTNGRDAILLVDDDSRVVDALALHLRRDFAVVKAASGPDGLARLYDSGPFLAIICDLFMPSVDGLELLAEAQGRCPHTIRILMTGDARIDRAAAAVHAADVHRLLLKPCPAQQITEAIRDAIDDADDADDERRDVAVSGVAPRMATSGAPRPVSIVERRVRVIPLRGPRRDG